MVKDEDVYPIETVVRIIKTGQLAIIKRQAFLKDGKSFLNYLGAIEGRGNGLYAIYHQDIELMPRPAHKTQYLTEQQVNLTWTYLHDKFGFDIKEWKKKFNEFHEQQKNGTDIVSSFYRFGNQNIEPVLNAILCRRDQHPTFNKLCEYIVKKN